MVPGFYACVFKHLQKVNIKENERGARERDLFQAVEHRIIYCAKPFIDFVKCEAGIQSREKIFCKAVHVFMLFNNPGNISGDVFIPGHGRIMSLAEYINILIYD